MSDTVWVILTFKMAVSHGNCSGPNRSPETRTCRRAKQETVKAEIDRLDSAGVLCSHNRTGEP